MACILINLALLFVQCANVNYSDTNNINGLYYGQRKGFFPQSIIFVTIHNDTAYAEGFYPLKGEFFATFTDMLYYDKNQNIFTNDTSVIYVKKNKLYFKRNHSLLMCRVEDTELKNDKDYNKSYCWFKEHASPYSFPFNRDNLLLLSETEGVYLNKILETTRKDFDFTNKKVGFLTGSSGKAMSNKEHYFDMHKKHSTNANSPCDNGTLYIFNAAQKAESGGYDAAIIYWSKFLLPVEDVIKRLKKKKK